jgi:hypothetical protein
MPSAVARRHSSAAPHLLRCNSRHGTDRASSATHGMAGIRMLSVACCTMHGVRLMPSVSCRVSNAATSRARSRSQQLSHAPAHARNVHARTLPSVWPGPMRRSGAKPQSARAPTLIWSRLCTYCAQQLQRIHRCRAVPACSSRRLRPPASRRRSWRA